METKIIFNGKQYASPEAMPEEVRQAYQDALAQFADADKNGIPHILERGSSGNVIAIQQSSISFNGREFKSGGEMPAIVRRLFELAMGQADANRNGIPDALEAALSGRETPFPTAGTAGAETAAAANVSTSNPPHQREPITAGLERTANALDIFLRILLSIVRDRHRGWCHLSHAQNGQRLSQSRRQILCRYRRARHPRRRGLAIS
jgi:hypothetical protein